ncbi:MAG: phospholipid carrier-dependent glycosyltransferase [Nostocales cyanobacterium ELA583]
MGLILYFFQNENCWLWIVIGAILRFTNLTAKPLWIDEFATLVFSLGNSFQTVPLNQIISVDTLLQPLQPHQDKVIGDVIHSLLTEDTHPPLYFVLAHLWVKLFSSEGGLVSLFAERSFSAFLGVICIPCTYLLARFSFCSQVVGQLAAAMMAISPFGISLAQEARHYTLGILWVIASLACLVIAIKQTLKRQPLSLLLILLWIGVNSLGIATHYFFMFTLLSIVITIVIFVWLLWKENQPNSNYPTSNIIKSIFNSLPLHFWQRISLVTWGTLAGILVWLPAIYQNREYGNLSSWLKINDGNWFSYINPLFQVLAAWIPMISLLPVEALQREVVIISVILMLVFLIWAIPILWRGLQFHQKQLATTKITQAFLSVVIGVNLCFFIVTYLFGTDLTRAPRYAFVYFPAVMVLLGASLAFSWQNSDHFHKFGIKGKQAVVIILLMGFCSGLTVVCNLAYQKSYRPNILVPIITENSTSQPLIVTIHHNLTETGEMMGIAWQFKFNNSQVKPSFLLIHPHKDDKQSNILKNTIQNSSKPLDIWLVNFEKETGLNKCVADNKSLPPVNGYKYQHFRC